MSRVRRVAQVVLSVAATVFSGFAINQLRLDRSTWPWWLAAAAAAFVIATIQLTHNGAQYRLNKATAQDGGQARAGNTGLAARGSVPADNIASARGIGSVAQAGDCDEVRGDPPIEGLPPLGPHIR